MPPASESHLVEQWLLLARGDLDFASSKPLRPEHYARLCYFAQQATEKAIKAVLTARGVTFPFTHNLQRLVELVPAAAEGGPTLAACHGAYQLRPGLPLPALPRAAGRI